MTAFAGLRVVLIARFNRRYHHVGSAIARALHQLGCEVTPFDERTRGLHRLLGVGLESRLRRTIRRSRPDLVLTFKAEQLSEGSITSLRGESRARWATWFPDPPHSLELAVRLARAHDIAFAFDSYIVERERAVGIDAHYLPFGCEIVPVRPETGSPGSRIVFVGSRQAERDVVLDAIDDLGLARWGPGYPLGPLFGSQLSRAICGAEVALNVHQFYGEPVRLADYGRGANLRVFELAALGTVQLCDAKQDIARHFQDRDEIVLFQSIAEMRALALGLLADPERRASIAARARARAEREHGWTPRLEELLTIALR